MALNDEILSSYSSSSLSETRQIHRPRVKLERRRLLIFLCAECGRVAQENAEKTLRRDGAAAIQRVCFGMELRARAMHQEGALRCDAQTSERVNTAMKKLLALGLLSMATLGLATAPASAWWPCFPLCGSKCCSKCCVPVCCRQYNAFSPPCCDSGCPINYGGGGCCPSSQACCVGGGDACCLGQLPGSALAMPAGRPPLLVRRTSRPLPNAGPATPAPCRTTPMRALTRTRVCGRPAISPRCTPATRR